MNADITLCFGEGCPMREKCLRFLTPPDEDAQSFFVNTPWANDGCNFFWRAKEKEK
jgi:hypothetical protein